MDARVRMFVQKMAQNRDELSGVGHVMPLHGRTDIINHHVADRLRPMLAVKQIVPQRGGNDLRDVTQASLRAERHPQLRQQGAAL